MSALTEQIRTVAALRLTAARTAERVKDAREAWNEENAEMLADQAAASMALNSAETALRELTIATFGSTGNKAPEKGVGIREVTKLAYDAADALKWAKTHDMALKLDAAAFEKIAKIDPPDFVQQSVEVTATIATDLSFALELVGAA